MKNILLTAVLLFIASFSFAQPSMAGRVLDVDGNPVVGANVYVLKTNKGAITSKEGRYLIDAINPGEYVVQISHVGYRTLTRQISIPENVPRYV